MKIFLVILSFLILGAHFLREGNLLLAILSVAAPCFLFIRKRWALVAVQTFLSCGALLWIFATIDLVQARMSQGMPWLRMAVILGAVAAFTAYSAWALNGSKFRQKYPG